MKSSSRNSNLELLRIICMIFIIMGHFCDQGLLFHNANGINAYILYIVGMGARISVNIFLIISVWYMVDRSFKSERILDVYLEDFFYCTIFTCLVLLSGYEVPLVDIFRGFFPFFGRPLWFISAYITLCFFAPFLNKILNIEESELRVFVFVSFVCVCVVCSLPDLQDAYLCDSMWFLFMYIWIGYIKKYKQNFFKKFYVQLFLCGVLIYVILVSGYFWGTNCDGVFANIVRNLFGQYLVDIKTMPNFSCALFIFLAVALGKPNHNALINTISKGTLSVYIVHQVPAFKSFLWFEVLCSQKIALSNWSCLYVVIFSVIIYTTVSVIDALRRNGVEKFTKQTSLYKTICNKINTLYKEN